MKFQILRKYSASALLLPVAGFAIFQTASQVSPAFANTLSTTANTIAQSAPTPTQTPKKQWAERSEKMFQELNLSADQQAQIKSIQEQSKTSNSGLREQVKTARENLKTLLASDSASDDAIRQAHQQVQTLSQQMGEQRFDSMLKVRSVLTPEQRTKMAELQKQHRQNHRQKGAASPGANS